MSNISEINNAITQAVSKVRSVVKKSGKSMQEPDYVAAITTEFPAMMTGKIPGVSFGSCFIHQKPKITFTSKIDGCLHICEIGDLLVICRKTIDGVERYNVALLQFKRSKSKTLSITTRPEEVQLEVYTSWPEFTIPHISQKFNIQPKTVNQGAQYGCIYEKLGHYSMMYAHIPEKTMTFTSDLTLGRFINDLMEWQDGRTINVEPDKNKEDWSKLIWTLIDITKSSFFRRKWARIYGKPRTSGEFFDLLCNMEQLEINTEDSENAEEIGMSLLVIDDKRSRKELTDKQHNIEKE